MHMHTIYLPTLQVSLAQEITGALEGTVVLEAGSLLLLPLRLELKQV